MKLSEWSRENGVCYKTAYNYFRQGRFEKTEVNEKGSIWIFEKEPEKTLEGILKEFYQEIKQFINKLEK